MATQQQGQLEKLPPDQQDPREMQIDGTCVSISTDQQHEMQADSGTVGDQSDGDGGGDGKDEKKDSSFKYYLVSLSAHLFCLVAWLHRFSHLDPRYATQYHPLFLQDGAWKLESSSYYAFSDSMD